MFIASEKTFRMLSKALARSFILPEAQAGPKASAIKVDRSPGRQPGWQRQSEQVQATHISPSFRFRFYWKRSVRFLFRHRLGPMCTSTPAWQNEPVAET